MFVCQFLGGRVFSLLLAVCIPAVELLGNRVTPCLASEGTARLFCKAVVLVHVPTSKVGGSSLSAALPERVICPHFFLLAILVGVKYLPKNVIAEIAFRS